ncbi:hypothetical protein [Spiroplasma endosymbiont of Aspidapion aeneum]|uniref:hypothetical protein n=1 Tax=Spiroplasma endosymbiont of Aspidapion aeneum TaxID=3066276 RepID=UPI00313EE7E7
MNKELINIIFIKTLTCNELAISVCNEEPLAHIVTIYLEVDESKHKYIKILKQLSNYKQVEIYATKFKFKFLNTKFKGLEKIFDIISYKFLASIKFRFGLNHLRRHIYNYQINR